MEYFHELRLILSMIVLWINNVQLGMLTVAQMYL